MPKVDLDKIINQLNYRPKKEFSSFLSLPNEEKAFVLFNLRKETQKKIISKFKNGDLAEILEHLDSDEINHIIQSLPKIKQNQVIDKLSEEIKNGVTFLSQFDPKTAAGLMSLNYIQVEETDTIAEVSKQIKIREKRTGKLPVIIVMKKGKIVGSLPGYRLGLCRASQSIKKVIEKVETVNHDTKTRELLKVFKRSPKSKVVVVGESGNVLGIIFANDALLILGNSDDGSLYSFAGVNKEEKTFDSVWRKVKNRYKWLILNLGTSFLAVAVVSSFEPTINKFVLLVAYMPIVAGMGGNAATQTLAIVVRGIGLGEISFKNSSRFILKEIGAGFINGIINGSIVALIAIFWNHSPLLGLVTGVAIFSNLIIASFFGSIIPLIMKGLGKDPATSATVFITSATDVIGFFVFLGLASIIL
jgi:magnesium transporter